MDEERRYLTALLRAALTQAEPTPPPDGLDMKAVGRLAEYGGVAALAASAVMRIKDVEPPEGFALCALEAERADTLRHVLIDPVLSALASAGIPCCPLKGWALKALYPREELREMSDIDLLLRPDDLDRAGEIMLANGFEAVYQNGHHRVYHTEPDMDVELHWRLTGTFEEGKWFDDDAWALTRQSADGGRELKPEAALVYAVLHAHKHLHISGAGARTILDLWLLEHRLCDAQARASARQTLDRLGLSVLYQSLSAIGESWLSGAALSPQLDAAAAYMLRIGQHGSYKRTLLRVMQQDIGRRRTLRLRLRYALFEAFPDRQLMAMDYPVLLRHSWLLPVCWLRRLTRLILRDRESLREGVRTARALSPGDELDYRNFMDTMYAGTNEDKQKGVSDQ